jgi:uncharacterized membrane protein
MPVGRAARIGLLVVATMALAFTWVFAAYLFAMHDALLTHGEDLGIMDQALWNTTHGALLHQTICNSVSDRNCLGDISRFAIHFEPIMLPLALLYRLAPTPKTLQLLQAAIVACGAFPAYWLAARRLRSVFAGVIFAALYLLYPALQAAVTFDFHAVTLSAAFLMFALYCLLARNDRGLVIACVLALATKEEVVLVVALIALSAGVLQRRWRIGGQLLALSAAWLVLEVFVMHLASPLGHSPTATRYVAFGHTPLQVAGYLLTHPVSILQRDVFQAQHLYYLRTLLAPMLYLPILSPLTLLIAAPVLAINLLSGDPAMYSGLYQYSAEIVPVLLLASVESVALLVVLGQRLAVRAGPRVEGWLWRRPRVAARWRAWLSSPAPARLLILGLVGLMLLTGLRTQRLHGYLPLTQGFTWPRITDHARIGGDLAQLIPPDASVSAQSDLVPHLSQRRYAYLFPYQDDSADYIFLDVTGNLYPQLDSPSGYADQVKALLASGHFHLLAAQDGYLLLQRAAAGTTGEVTTNLPASFYTFTTAVPQPLAHPLNIAFGDAITLVGYEISPDGPVYLNNPYLTVTTYWRISHPVTGTPRPELVMTLPSGAQVYDAQFATLQWLPMSAWQPGTVIAVRSWPQLLTGEEQGTIRLGCWVRTDAPGASAPQPLAVTSPVGTGQGAPLAILNAGATAVFADLRVTG